MPWWSSVKEHHVHVNNTSTHPKRKDTEDGTNRLLHLIHRAIVTSIDVLEILDKSINLSNTLTKKRLLTLKIGNKTLYLVKGTLASGTLLGFRHDVVDLFCTHEVERRGAGDG